VRLGLPARAAVASALTGLLLTASACGGDAKESPVAVKDEPSATATAAPTAKPPAQPSTSNDAQGRQQFARYVTNALTYAYATNDAAPIEAVAADTATQHCKACSSFSDYLADQKAKGQTLAGSTFPIRKILDTGQVGKGIWVLDVVTDPPAYTQVDASGKTIKRFPAEKGFVIEIGMTYDHGSYRLTGWKTGGQ
jgi:hypothetical protein